MQKVILVPTWELAENLVVEATVEAEYGKKVLEGTKVTLAHHVPKYSHNPAPCNAVVEPLEGEATIVVSHLDLDTIGGVMALMGLKPEDPDFWAGAEFVDLNGPHHAYKLSEVVREKLQAYWAWNSQNSRGARVTEITEVTQVVLDNAAAIQKIVAGDTFMLEEGRKWMEYTIQKTENCLVEECEKVRVFATDDVFTAASYYSPTFKKLASVTVSLNTKLGAITVATSDGSLNCAAFLQELFGPEAGGHLGIAGSPRGKKMNLLDFYETVQAVRRLLG